MRQFLEQQRNRIWMKALNSSIITCTLIYIVIRCISFDFPMTWKEEALLFFKILFSGTAMMMLATTGSAFIYKNFLRIKRNKKAA